MSNIPQEYRERLDSLSSQQRGERSMAMLKWTRNLIARQLPAELGPISQEQL